MSLTMHSTDGAFWRAKQDSISDEARGSNDRVAPYGETKGARLPTIIMNGWNKRSALWEQGPVHSCFTIYCKRSAR